MDILYWDEKSATFLPWEQAPPEFGSSCFMEKHYYLEDSFPSTSESEAHSIFRVYGVRNAFAGQFFRCVIDIDYAEGEILCFKTIESAIKYLNSMMPFIQYIHARSYNKDE